MYLSCRPFVVNTTFSTGLVGVEVYSVSWLGQLAFKLPVLIIVIVGFQSFVCCLVWAVYLGVKITDEGIKCCINNERPTGKKHTSVGWDDGET